MSEPNWILTKLGNATGMPIICSSEHPDYSPENYDVKIGQACFERNWSEGKLVNIADNISLTAGHYVFAFKAFLDDVGIKIPA
jgi:hypothetical protein